MHKRRSDRTDAEAKGCDRNEPAWAKVLAGRRRRDFENNVADVKDCQDDVVVISFETKVLFQTREFGIACPGTSSALTE